MDMRKRFSVNDEIWRKAGEGKQTTEFNQLIEKHHQLARHLRRDHRHVRLEIAIGIGQFTVPAA